MKSIVLKPQSKLLHVEAPGCIINIRVGLSDLKGRTVTAIEILPDLDTGGPRWQFADAPKARAMNVRVREAKKP